MKELLEKWWRSLDDDTREEIGYDYGFDADDPDSGWFKLTYKQKLKIYESENR